MENVSKITFFSQFTEHHAVERRIHAQSIAIFCSEIKCYNDLFPFLITLSFFFVLGIELFEHHEPTIVFKTCRGKKSV